MPNESFGVTRKAAGSPAVASISPRPLATQCDGEVGPGSTCTANGESRTDLPLIVTSSAYEPATTGVSAALYSPSPMSMIVAFDTAPVAVVIPPATLSPPYVCASPSASAACTSKVDGAPAVARTSAAPVAYLSGEGGRGVGGVRGELRRRIARRPLNCARAVAAAAHDRAASVGTMTSRTSAGRVAASPRRLEPYWTK